MVNTVQSLVQLQNFAGAAQTLIVTDETDGGLFNFHDESLTPDGVNIITAEGKGDGYWIRQKTSQIQNDGDGTSPYVTVDGLPQTSIFKESFVTVSGQDFTLSATPTNMLLVFLNGKQANGVPAAEIEYTTSANVLTIVSPTLSAGDVVSVVYANNLTDTSTYTKAEVDSLIAVAAGGFVSGINLASAAPTKIGMYTPTESGTYTNYGGIVVDLTEGFTIISYNGTIFSKQVVPIDLEGYVTDAELEPIAEKIDILFKQSNQISNTAAFIQAKSINATTGAEGSSVNWLSVGKQLLGSVTPKTLSGYGPLGSTVGRIFFYDASNVFISSILSLGSTQNTPITFTPPSNAVYFSLVLLTGTGVGSSPSTSPYIGTLMLNEGTVALPFEEYGEVFDKVAAGFKVMEQVFMSATGDDNNDGTEGSPIATFDRAKELVTESGEVILLQGDYENLTWDLSDFKTVKGKTGDRVRLIYYGKKITSATLHPGTTRVWKVPYVPIEAVTKYFWQHDIEDEATVIAMTDRHPLHKGQRVRVPSTRMYHAASIAAIESTTDKLTWFTDGTSFYFSKIDSSDLAVNPIILPNASALIGSDQRNINIENVQILYRPLQTTGLSGLISNVSVGMSNGVGMVRYDKTVGMTFLRCEAYGSLGDGFNGHVSDNEDNPYPYANQLIVEFIDCWGHDNADDGDSCHEYSNSSHNGGLFEFNGSGVTPATGAHTVCKNVTTQNNGAHDWTTDQTGTGFSAQGVAADDGVSTNIHCFNCISIGDKISFNGVGIDSKFINCISKGALTSAFGGTYQSINCVTL